MKIQPVDSMNNLFAVTNVLPAALLYEISQLDLNNIPWTKEDWQHEYNRKRLDPGTTLGLVDTLIKDNLNQINEITGMNAYGCSTGFWLDGPGFTMTSHIDNSDVFASMQLFLLDNELCPGTKFTSNGALRHLFEYKKNTGYLMINGIDQYHETAGTVPQNTLRLSGYTWFYTKL